MQILIRPTVYKPTRICIIIIMILAERELLTVINYHIHKK